MPIMWFIAAEELRLSYLVLADHANKMFSTRSCAKTLSESLNDTLPSSLMLAGYSIENYLKGIIIKNSTGCAFDSNGKFVLKFHDLVDLATNAKVSIGDDETELLKRLHHFVMVVGRYPIPLKAIDMQPVYFNDGSIGPISTQLYNNNKKSYEIYEKIDLFFEKLKAICPIES